MSVKEMISKAEKLPYSVRFLIPALGALLVFLVFSIAFAIRPRLELRLVQIYLPISLFILGGLWSLLRHPWYLSWIIPALFFALTVFLWLRPDAYYLLIGYIPINLAGSFLVFGFVRYLAQKRVSQYHNFH